jgi:hypothetical protein
LTLLIGAASERFVRHDIEVEAEEVEAELHEADAAVLHQLDQLRAHLDALEVAVRARRG